MVEQVNKNPARVIHCGPVKASIWSNARLLDDAVVELYSIRIDKSYKDGQEWKSTVTFNAEDLPKVAMVANEAYKFIRLRSSQEDVQ